jgi:predicted lipid-binding transport protein (Tim44 family)
VFDIFTIIIFLALAVFIFLQLRRILGQRTSRERPPYEVTLPSRPAKAPPRPAKASQPPGDRWKGIAESGSAVAAGLDAIATADPSFDAKHFITGARTAYEMIVTSFAEGDRRQLRSLLSREVYNRFDAAITEREGRGETAETRFVSIDGLTVTAAELRGRTRLAARSQARRFPHPGSSERPDNPLDDPVAMISQTASRVQVSGYEMPATVCSVLPFHATIILCPRRPLHPTSKKLI